MLDKSYINIKHVSFECKHAFLQEQRLDFLLKALRRQNEFVQDACPSKTAISTAKRRQKIFASQSYLSNNARPRE